MQLRGFVQISAKWRDDSPLILFTNNSSSRPPGWRPSGQTTTTTTRTTKTTRASSAPCSARRTTTTAAWPRPLGGGACGGAVRQLRQSAPHWPASWRESGSGGSSDGKAGQGVGARAATPGEGRGGGGHRTAPSLPHHPLALPRSVPLRSCLLDRPP